MFVGGGGGLWEVLFFLFFFWGGKGWGGGGGGGGPLTELIFLGHSRPCKCFSGLLKMVWF